MNVLVSIIVPVFNAEKYLPKTINSLQNQTYKNLEIILVDDGSTDLSREFCDKYGNNDKRIKVFHIRNCGSAKARNYGLKKASGKYIMFVDSDDFLERNGIELLTQVAEKYNLDMLCGRYNYVDDLGNKLNVKAKSFFKNLECKDIMDGERYLCINGLEPMLWKYLYLRKHLMKNKLQLKSFDGNGCYEDMDFVIKAIHKCNKIMYTDTIFYNYRQINSSQSKRREANLSYNLLNIADELLIYSDLEVRSNICKEFFVKYIDALYGQAVQRIIQLKCNFEIFNDTIFKEKVANRLLKSRIKRYRIVGFCLKFNLMYLYSKVYYYYRKLYLNYNNLDME